MKKVHGIDTNYNNIKRDEKKTYGQFQNVFLSEIEYQDLLNKIGSRINEYIERLSSSISTTSGVIEFISNLVLLVFRRSLIAMLFSLMYILIQS